MNEWVLAGIVGVGLVLVVGGGSWVMSKVRGPAKPADKA